jgi:hypothetical protein
MVLRADVPTARINCGTVKLDPPSQGSAGSQMEFDGIPDQKWDIV